MSRRKLDESVIKQSLIHDNAGKGFVYFQIYIEENISVLQKSKQEQIILNNQEVWFSLLVIYPN